MNPKPLSRHEDRVAALLPGWLSWLRIRQRSLALQHADLVQEAAADLLQWLVRHHDTVLAEDDLRRVGFRILQRRVADAFRESVGEWSRQPSERELEGVSELPDPSPGANPAQALQHARLMRALVEVLTELGPEERSLLLGDEMGDAVDEVGPRSAAERQRLSRLRERVRTTLIQRHGIDVRRWPEE